MKGILRNMRPMWDYLPASASAALAAKKIA
jgi:hypothetical protein